MTNNWNGSTVEDTDPTVNHPRNTVLGFPERDPMQTFPIFQGQSIHNSVGNMLWPTKPVDRCIYNCVENTLGVKVEGIPSVSGRGDNPTGYATPLITELSATDDRPGAVLISRATPTRPYSDAEIVQTGGFWDEDGNRTSLYSDDYAAIKFTFPANFQGDVEIRYRVRTSRHMQYAPYTMPLTFTDPMVDGTDPRPLGPDVQQHYVGDLKQDNGSSSSTNETDPMNVSN